ncbi:MAG: hypothetical protein IJ235_06420 [Eubacterium sp.]|nr:hypothetical protein [Eubacterium sp.]MBQ8980330.1 hypothetical protein [Eubacterium sp.]MBR1531888.1 hypothetical protein [Eubacterium sp.]MBR2278252.1 hypothetical protein [Eubacterium sp.]
MKLVKALLTLFAVFCGFFVVTFSIYYTNSDMKLVRVIYDKMQPYYDNLKKDRKL